MIVGAGRVLGGYLGGACVSGRLASAFPVVRVPAPTGWLNSNDRLHRQAEAKLVKAWREAAKTAAPERPAYTEPVRIWCEIWKPRANRYDPGNLYPTAKACVDGFRDAGLLVDDDWRHVEGPHMIHGGLTTSPALVFRFEAL